MHGGQHHHPAERGLDDLSELVHGGHHHYPVIRTAIFVNIVQYYYSLLFQLNFIFNRGFEYLNEIFTHDYYFRHCINIIYTFII